MAGWKEEKIDGWIKKQMDGWMDRKKQNYGQMDI